jgi:hypothetical protein
MLYSAKNGGIILHVNLNTLGIANAYSTGSLLKEPKLIGSP